MTTVPWLTILWVLPLIGAVLVFALPARMSSAARVLGLATAVAVLLVGIFLAVGFSPSGDRYQYVESQPWIPSFGSAYRLGIDGIALTKLDVLDGFETLKVCTGYRLDGEVIDYLPASQGAQARVEPIYEEVEGWRGSTAGARSWAELPAEAVKYVRRIEELIGAPVTVLSTSPERRDTILVQNPFEA